MVFELARGAGVHRKMPAVVNPRGDLVNDKLAFASFKKLDCKSSEEAAVFREFSRKTHRLHLELQRNSKVYGGAGHLAANSALLLADDERKRLKFFGNRKA